MGVAAFRRAARQREGLKTPPVEKQQEQKGCPKCGNTSIKTGLAVHIKYCKGKD